MKVKYLASGWFIIDIVVLLVYVRYFLTAQAICCEHECSTT